MNRGAILRDPLAQFIVLGAALFLLSGFAGRKENTVAPATIVISPSLISNLASAFARTWQRAPSEQEQQDLLENYIRDEIFYREGKAAGLDRDDAVIRRRIRQKMEYIVEDIAYSEPSDEQLTTFLASHSERFRTPDRLSFRQVFLSEGRRSTTMNRQVQIVETALNRADATVDISALGDSFLLGEDFKELELSEIASLFGDGFVKQLSLANIGRWSGPITSSFGQHFVFLKARAQGNLPSLSEIREKVQREWGNERRNEEVQKLYRGLRERYTVILQPPDKQEPVGAVK